MVRKSAFFLTLIAAVITSCTSKHLSDNSRPVLFDLDSIIRRGKLIAVTDYNSTNYFIYRGEPMGFNYEMLKQFAGNLGVDLEIITENNLDNAFGYLETGAADLVAIGLTVSSERKKEIRFSEPLLETRQVLVQRKPQNWRKMTEEEIGRKLIRNQLDLAGKKVFVQESSSHADRLRSLENEIGDSINIISVPYDPEKLIRDVMKGVIDYTVCDENVALVNSGYFPDIDVSTPVSFLQNIAWGVRITGSDQLLAALNKWITGYRSTDSYAMLYAKYFMNTSSATIVKSDYYYIGTGKISMWDDLIRSASRNINWDWRLVASLICQESRFDPQVRSWAGAVGLMQVMPETGRTLGIDITSSPASNVRAGTLYLKELQEIFESKIEDPHERVKFVLASYNAGPGYVLEAMKLAEKSGLDPLKWDGNVDTYFRSTESLNFVSQILDRYEHYKNIVSDFSNAISMDMEEIK